jgi:beta-galactosidase
MAGVEVEEYDSLPLGATNRLELCLPGWKKGQPQVSASVWCDVLKPTTAEVVGRYTRDYYAGKAAITWNSYGKGRVLYVGTLGEAALFGVLADWLLDHTGVQPVLSVPAGVEATARWQDGRRLLFVLNHTGQEQTVELEHTYTTLLEGTSLAAGAKTLPPREVWLLVDGSS